MVLIRKLAIAAMAALALSGCTTGSVDGTKTTAIAQPPSSPQDMKSGTSPAAVIASPVNSSAKGPATAMKAWAPLERPGGFW